MKDAEVIFGEMKAELERLSSVAVNEGGDMALRLYAVAVEISSLWTQVEWIKRQIFPQSAVERCLDLHAQTRGLVRGQCMPASGSIRFETQDVCTEPVIIPKGTVCLNFAGAEFITIDDAVIEKGSSYCLARAVSRIPGTGGNAPAESICYMALAPVGVVRCFNPASFSGGTDAESDDSLRARVLASFKSLPNGSNTAFYKAAALDTDGVAAVNVVPRSRGLGTVDIYISGVDGVPSQDLIDTVRNKIQREREICVDIAVLPPRVVNVPVAVSIELEDGYEYSYVSKAVEAALTAYFDGKLLGKNLLLARLGSVVFGVEGVANYCLTKPSMDIQVAHNELPTAGIITVTRS